jgi:hypothetical protein
MLAFSKNKNDDGVFRSVVAIVFQKQFYSEIYQNNILSLFF